MSINQIKIAIIILIMAIPSIACYPDKKSSDTPDELQWTFVCDEYDEDGECEKGHYE